MKRKILSILMAVIMTVSAASVSVLAAESTDMNPSAQTVIDDETAQRQAVRAAAAAIIGKDPSDDITVSNDFVNEVLDNVGEEPTAKSISDEISKYAGLFKSKTDEYAREIADSAEYYIADDGEFFIIVDITKHPEVLELTIMCKASRLMLNKQNQNAAQSDRECITMDYRHIVGELALHNTIYALTKAFGGANEKSPLHGYYESAKVAELNRNEQRGADYIRIVGGFFDLCYKIFSTIFHQFL